MSVATGSGTPGWLRAPWVPGSLVQLPGGTEHTSPVQLKWLRFLCKVGFAKPLLWAESQGPTLSETVSFQKPSTALP